MCPIYQMPTCQIPRPHIVRSLIKLLYIYKYACIFYIYKHACIFYVYKHACIFYIYKYLCIKYKLDQTIIYVSDTCVSNTYIKYLYTKLRKKGRKNVVRVIFCTTCPACNILYQWSGPKNVVRVIFCFACGVYDILLRLGCVWST
jgi:hypothetical protein